MNNIVAVQIHNSAQCLCEKLEGLGLAKYVFGILVIKQISHLRVLHHHVDILTVVKRVPDFYNMGVVYFRVQFYLSLHKFYLGLSRQIAQTNLDNEIRTIFSAYIRFVLVCSASFTVPNDPLPNFLSSIKLNY